MLPMKDVLDLANMAEDRGIAGLWFAEHFGYRDAISSCAAVLKATEEIAVSPAALSIYAHHPMLAAMAIASLSEVGPDRTLVGLATGNPQSLRESGLRGEKPIEAMRGYFTALRKLLACEETTGGGPFQLAGARMHFREPTAVPLCIAAMGPKMLRLSGEIADGVVLSAAIPRSFIAQSLELVRAGAASSGRSGDEIALIGFVLAAVAEERDAAYAAGKRMLAYLFRNDFIAHALSAASIEVDRERIAQAAVQENWELATALIPDAVVEECALVGTVNECATQLSRFRSAGLEHPVLVPVGDSAARRLAIELAAA
jgi:5,10-methylenetetrahydromethanopterin reductase